MTVHAELKFHGVGQGLFYSGIITRNTGKNTKQFVMVYDCGVAGKKTYLKNEIEELFEIVPKRELSKAVIDLLTISHFDYDHISGLKDLFRRFSVETVVIPYIHDLMKLWYILELSEEQEIEDSWLWEFYVDPIAFFYNEGVNRIIVLGYPESDNEIYNGEKIEDVREDLEIDDIPPKILLMGDKCNLKNKGFSWKFCFFNIHKNENDLEDIKKFFLKKKIDPKRLLKDQNALKEIKKIYKKIDVINDTSVVLRHYPDTNREIFISHLPQLEDCQKIKNYQFFKSIYLLLDRWQGHHTVLTGDLDCNRYFEELKFWCSSNQWRDFGGFVLLVPHHGSKNNWPKGKWQGNEWKKKECCCCYAKICIVSYGISNRYGHPSYDVEEDVLDNGGYLVNVNQRGGFSYSIVLDMIDDEL